MSIETYAKYWAENYKEDLTHNIMPFWLKNGLDKEHGGIYTCVARNGQLTPLNRSGFRDALLSFARTHITILKKILNGWMLQSLHSISSKSIVSTLMEECISR
jgi:hypothetical protein